MPYARPSFDQMSAQTTTLVVTMFAKHKVAQVADLGAPRNIQVAFLVATKESLEKSNHTLEERAAIYAGAVLFVSERAVKDYHVTSYTNSTLYNEAYKVLGVGAENKMSAAEKGQALATFKDFFHNEIYVEASTKTTFKEEHAYSGIEGINLTTYVTRLNESIEAKNVLVAAEAAKLEAAAKAGKSSGFSFNLFGGGSNVGAPPVNGDEEQQEKTQTL